jgi:hypothetical protein
MKHVRVTDMGRDYDPVEDRLVHYVGVPQIGSHTLCGHTDRTVWTFEITTGRVNCIGCIATRKHVMGR